MSPPAGKHFSNINLSDLSIVGTCDILVYRMHHKTCYPHDWLIQTYYQSASSHVTETTFLTPKCFSVENFIIVLLNTLIPIIVIVQLPKIT